MSMTFGIILTIVCFVIGLLGGGILGIRNISKHPEKAVDMEKMYQVILAAGGQKKNPQQLRQLMNQMQKKMKR